MPDIESTENPDANNSTAPANKDGISRKKFITLASFGAVGAAVALTLQRGIPGLSSGRKNRRVVGNNLPGEGSIFQPKNPPKA